MNEAETRAEHIDPALRDAGWGVVEGSRILREYPITPGRIEGLGRGGKPLIADYVLVYLNTRLVVVEAKAWDVTLTEGVGQAKNYAGKLAIRFAYATNGQGIYAIDMETGKEGEASVYPTPEQLWALTFAEENAWCDRFAAVPFEDKGGSHPEFFHDEDELRDIWSVPDTRRLLLEGLAEKGFGRDQLAEMQRIIDAENSDIFDVLAHVAYAVPPVTREVRAANARLYGYSRFSEKQQTFLAFVLQHYVNVGVEELDQEKLTPLLRLRYNDSIADAIADLGRPEEIGSLFAGFQKYLYQQQAAA
jgi:hypothetical protein